MRHVAFGAALAAASALASAGSAEAATFDSLAAFDYHGYSQGLLQCQLASPSCVAVDAARTGLDKAFDTSSGAPVITTFHSLGAYGFATFGVGPHSAIRGATTLEATFGNQGGASWPEAMTIVLHNGLDEAGLDGWSGELQSALEGPGGSLDQAALFAFGGGPVAAEGDITGSNLFTRLNANVLEGSGQFAGYVTNGGDIIAASGVSITLTDAGTNGWRYQIDIAESLGDFSYITFLDQTMSDTPSYWQTTRGDGWDLAHLSVTADVPEPATAALFGLGVLAAGGLRRRR